MKAGGTKFRCSSHMVDNSHMVRLIKWHVISFWNCRELSGASCKMSNRASNLGHNQHQILNSVAKVGNLLQGGITTKNAFFLSSESLL